MKALEILKAVTENEGTHLWLDDGDGYPKSYIYEAIEELEILMADYKYLGEYYRFAKNHLESYRCKCGALGRVGYLCSNNDCKCGS